MHRSIRSALLVAALVLVGRERAFGADHDRLSAPDAPPDAIWIESIGLEKMMQRRGLPRAGRTIRDAPISLAARVYPHGIGTRSISEFVIDVHGGALRFESMVGLDDAVKAGVGSVTFEVWADDRLVAASGRLRAGDAPRFLSADLRDAHVLTLLLDDGGDTSNDDEASWAGALIYMKANAQARPVPYARPAESTPLIAPARDLLKPQIHGPRVTGATPGRPFLFRVPATGRPPLRFQARNLPPGLVIDDKTGIISGSLRGTGETQVAVEVSGPNGVARRTLTIIGGTDALARTPPMGWNSWNAWGAAVDAQKVLAAADALESTGLAAHGFQYVVIDDGWEGGRDAQGEIRPNDKFPDLRALADALHARGLKLGIYSSPGPKTCEGYEGSWQHEAQDAATYARWGVDFLKYDWCSYEERVRDPAIGDFQKPYIVMRDALARVDRDIVYSLCQYGFADVWQWGTEVGGNLWRTSGDLLDMWANLESVGFRQSGRELWTRPGHWNDTDMLVVGTVGWGPQQHPTRLTPNEQMMHLALWSLQAAPLFVGADLTRLDPFTLALLTNDEVLDVNQDPLGRAAGRIWKDGRLEIWARPLADGTVAAGLFNRGLTARPVSLRWSDLNLRGRQPVRDLWERQDRGRFLDTFTATVPSHGVVFVKIGRPQPRS